MYFKGTSNGEFAGEKWYLILGMIASEFPSSNCICHFLRQFSLQCLLSWHYDLHLLSLCSNNVWGLYLVTWLLMQCIYITNVKTILQWLFWKWLRMSHISWRIDVLIHTVMVKTKTHLKQVCYALPAFFSRTCSTFICVLIYLVIWWPRCLVYSL